MVSLLVDDGGSGIGFGVFQIFFQCTVDGIFGISRIQEQFSWNRLTR